MAENPHQRKTEGRLQIALAHNAHMTEGETTENGLDKTRTQSRSPPPLPKKRKFESDVFAPLRAIKTMRPVRIQSALPFWDQKIKCFVRTISSASQEVKIRTLQHT